MHVTGVSSLLQSCTCVCVCVFSMSLPPSVVVALFYTTLSIYEHLCVSLLPAHQKVCCLHLLYFHSVDIISSVHGDPTELAQGLGAMRRPHLLQILKADEFHFQPPTTFKSCALQPSQRLSDVPDSVISARRLIRLHSALNVNELSGISMAKVLVPSRKLLPLTFPMALQHAAAIF